MRVSLQPVLRVVAALAVALVGYGHLRLWLDGYRYTPVRELFLLNFGVSSIIALVLLIGPRRIAAVLGAGVAALTMVAFGLSRGPGVPTLHGIWVEKGFAPANIHLLGPMIAVTLLVAEAVTIVAAASLFLLHPAAEADDAPPATEAGSRRGLPARLGLARGSAG